MKFTQVVNPSSTPQTITVEVADPVITATGETPIETTPSVNQLPKVSAGTNVTIKLPVDSAKLNGVASDPDGIIAAVLWEKISGSGTIDSSQTLSTAIRGLSEGTSVFRLTVLDDHGASASDDVSIIVQAADVVTPPADYGTLVYENKYSKASDINSNQLGEGGFATVDGIGAFKSLVTGKVSESGSYRSEQQFDGSLYNPTEFVLEYDAKYENWKNFGNNSGHVVQWHPYKDGGSATISIYGYQGQFEIVRNIAGTNYRDNGYVAGKRSIPANVWMKHRWEIKWGSAGYVKLFLDDVLYFSFTGVTKVESQNPYFKLGQNRWVVAGGSSVVYYRNLKIWKR